MNQVILAGRISRLAGGMGPDGPLCTFRLGNVPCRAAGELSLVFVAHQGYPAHEVEVSGELIMAGKKKVLEISSFRMVD